MVHPRSPGQTFDVYELLKVPTNGDYELILRNLAHKARMLSVINKGGFRSLADGEEVEFEAIPSDKGMEATQVSGPGGLECRGSERRPMSRKKFRKIRCYNCGDFGSHIASKCPHGPLPKRCHNCKSSDHLIADCPLKDVLTSAAAMSLKGNDGTGNNNNNDATNGHGVLTSV